MIDHFMLMVKDKEKSKSFYEKLLMALGHSLCMTLIRMPGLAVLAMFPFG